MSIFPGQYVSCVLSIGSGAQGVIDFKTTSTTELTRVRWTHFRWDSERVVWQGHAILSAECRPWAWSHRFRGLGKAWICKNSHAEIPREIWCYAEDVSTGGGSRSACRWTIVLIILQSFAHVFINSNGEYYQGDFDGSRKFSGWLITWRNLEYVDLRVNSERRGTGSTLSFFHFKRVTIHQPSRAATETLNMQCALLRDTLESCMQGRNFTELPDELKGNIEQLLKYVHPLTIIKPLFKLSLEGWRRCSRLPPDKKILWCTLLWAFKNYFNGFGWNSIFPFSKDNLDW